MSSLRDLENNVIPSGFGRWSISAFGAEWDFVLHYSFLHNNFIPSGFGDEAFLILFRLI